MKSLHKNNQGIAHLAIIMVVVVLAVVGAVGWYVFNKQKNGGNSLSDAVKQATQKCEIDDKDICKFFASWKENKYYVIDSTNTSGGKTTTSKMEYVAPDRYHMVSTDPAYETINIGDTTYTKDMSDGKWWKQTVAKTETNSTEEAKVDFEEPTDDKPAEQQTTYKLIAKEACGDLTCFKYQVLDPANKETVEYIWFDTEDYQLRKTRTESKGDVYEAVFSYTKIEINEPSPVKELGANQSVVPGSSVPMDGPSEAELQQIQAEIDASR